MTIEEKVSKLEKQVKELMETRRVQQGGIAPKAVQQQDINGIIIFRGLASERPTNGDTEIQAFYAEDTKTLSIWNTVNEAWEVEVLT